MNEVKGNKKSIIIEFILANAFILNLAVGMISNYSPGVFLLKIFSSLILFILILGDTRLSNFNLKTILGENNPKKMLLILGLLISYLSLTLIYSQHPLYGFQKLLNFLTSTIPSVFAFYYLIVTVSKERFKIFIVALVTITLITVTYILIDYPFEPGTIYEYRAGRWSHVIYGRLIGSIAVVLFLYTLSRKDLFQILLYSVVSSIAIYGLYLSSLRSAMIGVVLCVVLSALFFVYEMIARREKRDVRCKTAIAGKCYPVSGIQYRNSNFKKLSGLLTVIIVTITFIVFIPKPEIIDTRFDNLTQFEDMKFGGDEPINTRIEALKISKELFLEHPVFGVGFGGFRSYNEFTEIVKYPHNIFVEMAVEGGVVGVLVLCALLFVLIKYTYRFSISHPEFISGSAILLFASFAFFLAFFSKELSNQALLWIFIAFVGLKNRVQKGEVWLSIL